IAKLADLRKELRNNLQKAKSGEVHDDLNAMALEYMRKLATGNYHPAVQLNAVLMIGDLNKEDVTGTGNPKPLPEALKSLIAVVQDAKNSDAIRAAALVGILRHAAAGITDEDAKTTLTTTILKLGSETDPPDGGSAVGHDWICGQALET